MLAGASWRTVSWRRGTKGRLSARFAAVRVRVADGPTQRIRDMGHQHMPGDEAWLIGELRASGERKYYLSNLPPTRRSKRSPARSRRAGSASRPIGNSRKSLGSITSKDDPGLAFIGMH